MITIELGVIWDRKDESCMCMFLKIERERWRHCQIGPASSARGEGIWGWVVERIGKEETDFHQTIRGPSRLALTIPFSILICTYTKQSCKASHVVV